MIAEKYAQEVQAILDKYPPDQRRSAVMPLLYLAQRDKMYVSREDMAEIGEIIGLSATEVASIVGFYSLYYDEPGGKYRIQVCNDLPCALRGAKEIAEHLKSSLGVGFGETTEDGRYTLKEGECMGACGDAPMCLHNNHTMHTHLTPEKVDALLDELK